LRYSRPIGAGAIIGNAHVAPPKKVIIDSAALQHIAALREVNKALIDGLKTAVYFLAKVEEIPEERRKSMIESLNGLIARGEVVYGEAPTRH
jgi:hypothetical protein